MLRTYPICHSGTTHRPEGLRAIIRRLEAEIERRPQTIRVTPPARPQQFARS